MLFTSNSFDLFSQKKNDTYKSKKKELLEKAKIEADKEEIDITLRSVDITRFPEIKLLIEAYNKLGEPLDTLTPEQIT